MAPSLFRHPRRKKQKWAKPVRTWPGGFDLFARIADGCDIGNTSQQHTQHYLLRYLLMNESPHSDHTRRTSHLHRNA